MEIKEHIKVIGADGCVTDNELLTYFA